eukprot:jgi/Mesvir1/13186/Mv06146-RA.1
MASITSLTGGVTVCRNIPAAAVGRAASAVSSYSSRLQRLMHRDAHVRPAFQSRFLRGWEQGTLVGARRHVPLGSIQPRELGRFQPDTWKKQFGGLPADERMVSCSARANPPFTGRTRISDVKHAPDGGLTRVGEELTIKGWVRTVRKQKTFSFIEVNDGSTLAGLQVVAQADCAGYDAIESGSLCTGASITCVGTLVASQGGKQKVELAAKSLSLVGGVDDPATYPLQKKRHTFEFLRSIAHLRPRTNTLGAVARIRHALSLATHQFFASRGFVWVSTPIITASDCEGAGEQFLVTSLVKQSGPGAGTLPVTDSGSVDFSSDFFGRPAYLTVSGQLNAEIYATALSDVYTFGPTFRAENSNTTRHLAEFWMIEPEMAFADLKDDMACAEAYLKHVIRHVLDHCSEDMAFFDEFIAKGIVDRLEAIVAAPFAHVTYTSAVEMLASSGHKFEFPPSWGADLQTEHERYLTEKLFKNIPVIVTDYPKGIKAFYMRENPDGKTVAAMDILVPGVGELIGGSQREERVDVLRRRIKEIGLEEAPYWWYLDLRRYGSVPHAGFGLGFERLVQFVTGMENIRDVIPFPRTPSSAEF